MHGLRVRDRPGSIGCYGSRISLGGPGDLVCFRPENANPDRAGLVFHAFLLRGCESLARLSARLAFQDLATSGRSKQRVGGARESRRIALDLREHRPCHHVRMTSRGSLAAPAAARSRTPSSLRLSCPRTELRGSRILQDGSGCPACSNLPVRRHPPSVGLGQQTMAAGTRRHGAAPHRCTLSGWRSTHVGAIIQNGRICFKCLPMETP